MKSIAIDFSNHMLCIMTDGQQGTEQDIELLSDKSKFYEFIPEKYREHSSFTWNFEDGIFAINQDYVIAEGCIMTHECFIPELIIPMPGLSKKWDRMKELLCLEEVNFKEDVKANLPDLAKLFGWK